MCKRKNKKKSAENAAAVGTSATITGKTVGNAKVVTQVKPPGAVKPTPSSVSTGAINPKVAINAPPKKNGHKQIGTVGIRHHPESIKRIKDCGDNDRDHSGNVYDTRFDICVLSNHRSYRAGSPSVFRQHQILE